MVKYSVGRGTKMRHSTAREWDELDKESKQSGYNPVSHSTGESASIKHSTGIQTDLHAFGKKAEEEGEEKEEKKKGLRSKVRSKPKTEGEDYLGMYRTEVAKGRTEK